MRKCSNTQIAKLNIINLQTSTSKISRFTFEESSQTVYQDVPGHRHFKKGDIVAT